MRMKKWMASVTLGAMLVGGTYIAFTPEAHAATVTTQSGSFAKVVSGVYFKKSLSNHEVYGLIPAGTELKVLDASNQYYVKVSHNGNTGYVSKRFLSFYNKQSAPSPAKPATNPAAPASKPTAPSAGSKADKLISFAESLQGKVQYGYAKRVTADPNHLVLDCSSYTQYVFNHAVGQYIPWSANAQHNAFPHVNKSDLQKGDLVFFSVGSSKYIGHVGIYIGGGKFIHNVNTTSDVEISDMSSGYWQRHYIDASRVLK